MMTPEERAVIEAAMTANPIGHSPTTAQLTILRRAVHQLIFTCPQCNAGGHTCPGDGNPIGHTQTDCGQHDDPPIHAGADGSCPDYGSTLDPCPPGCASGTCVAGRRSADSTALEWVETTMRQCLAGDRIRIGAEETDVIRSSSGIWHADTSDAWHPRAWEHLELRMELAVVPGFTQYPPNASVEILMSPERKAVHLLNQAFPGTKKL